MLDVDWDALDAFVGVFFASNKNGGETSSYLGWDEPPTRCEKPVLAYDGLAPPQHDFTIFTPPPVPAPFKFACVRHPARRFQTEDCRNTSIWSTCFMGFNGFSGFNKTGSLLRICLPANGATQHRRARTLPCTLLSRD